jgi:hypothetical protein
VVAAGSLAVRYRRAKGMERQQLRWLALAATVAAVALVVAVAAAVLGGTVGVVLVAAGASVVVLPLATGAAILRYRLYDLDRIVSRTLAWGLLTLLLGLGYAAVVLGLGRLLPRAPAWPWPRPPWPWPPPFSRPAATSNARLTASSTAVATTRPGSSRPSVLGCATRSTSTASRLSSWGRSTRSCSQPKRRSGYGPNDRPTQWPTPGAHEGTGKTWRREGGPSFRFLGRVGMRTDDLPITSRMLRARLVRGDRRNATARAAGHSAVDGWAG